MMMMMMRMTTKAFSMHESPTSIEVRKRRPCVFFEEKAVGTWTRRQCIYLDDRTMRLLCRGGSSVMREDNCRFSAFSLKRVQCLSFYGKRKRRHLAVCRGTTMWPLWREDNLPPSPPPPCPPSRRRRWRRRQTVLRSHTVFSLTRSQCLLLQTRTCLLITKTRGLLS